ncbi:MFS transporter [Paramicrobacterium chengjingii]|uniref:MHS family MFS transporter n=1 Tax=Paramicrobacterium chengjingii TaxID=2769067 RepID=A0ABX6YJM5_9MICO|nr:MFS transporter [Microbacterium chengjingii]QPZ38992.1 MHS family MFS transporter [Microbacterium chengjingii]
MQDNVQPENAGIQKVGISALIGSAIEWYDFYIYGTAAALVFGTQYFPSFSPVAGTLAAFATFAVGFIARPIGAIIFGHFGDRVGRKNTLVLTLLIMGCATVLIGAVPNYSTIGVWAPIALTAIRFIQGFAVGGEWGGATTMVVEHSPRKKRGFYGGLPQMGVPIGLVLSTAVFSAVSALPDDDFMSWGWRIPFFLSALLILVGLLIRVKIEETPTFAEMAKAGGKAKIPFKEALVHGWKEILLTAALYLGHGVLFYVITVFVLSYGTSELGLPESLLLTCVMIAAGLEILLVPAFGALSDKLGRRTVYIAGAVGAIVMAFPFFAVLETGSPILIGAITILVITLCHAAMYGPIAAWYAEMFGPSVRYTGTSIGYQIGGAISGFAPMIAGVLVGTTGGASWPLGLMWMIAVGIGIAAALIAKETRGVSLTAKSHPSDSSATEGVEVENVESL